METCVFKFQSITIKCYSSLPSLNNHNNLSVISFFQDVPLFEGIISDLFPGVECPKPDYGVFMEALKDNIRKRQLQPVPWFLDKIIQVIVCLIV